MSRTTVLGAIAALAACAAVQSADYYVNPNHPNASDLNEGTDPLLPLATLQAALDKQDDDEFSPFDVIHVAKATYTPCKPTDAALERTATFVVKPGTTLLGGYPASTTFLDTEHDSALPENRALLSGAIGGTANCGLSGGTFTAGIRSYNVVVLGQPAGTPGDLAEGDATIVGFEVADGVADWNGTESCTEHRRTGGGISAASSFDGASAVVRHCEVRDNTAVERGGGIGGPSNPSCAFSNLVVRECDIHHNACAVAGGAVAEGGGGLGGYGLQVSESLIHQNATDNDGGGLAEGGDQTFGESYIVNCWIAFNEAAQGGGAAVNSVSRVDGSAFVNNVALGDPATGFGPGGGLLVSNVKVGGMTIANCTFAGNTGTFGAGDTQAGCGLYVAPESVHVLNSVFHANEAVGGTAPATPGEGHFVQVNLTGQVMGRCCVEDFDPPPLGGGTACDVLCTGPCNCPDSLCCDNFDADPLFVDLAAGDVRLTWPSPCRDQAVAALVPNDIADVNDNGDFLEELPLDLGSLPRVLGAEPDIGAYETIGCAGDLDGSGGVDGADLGTLLAAWGRRAFSNADMNGDGVVDGADLGLLLGAWGPCPAGLASFGGASSEALASEGTGGLTPALLAQALGFEDLQSFASWLLEMEPEAMQAWLETMLGG